MDPNQQRRRFLAGIGAIGAAGMAGCTDQITGSVGDDPDDDEGGDDDNDGETPTDTPTETDDDGDEPDEGEQYVHSGETIPTYPYLDGEVDFDPTDSTPDPDADNPVFTHEDVPDDEFEDTEFVADPFFFVEEGEWHMFMELLEVGHGGQIIHAESDDEGLTWEYTGVALREDWHLAHPQVFKWEGDYYMTPQALPTTRPPVLYKANAFPHDWYPLINELYDPAEHGHEVTDHAMFRWNDHWWNIAGGQNENTYIYHNDKLERDGWEPHEDNPVVEGRPEGSRPGGRPIVLEDRIFIPFQQTEDLYGETIQGYWITELTTDSYEDEHIGTIIDGTGQYTPENEPAWNSLRMHHYDPWFRGEEDGWRIVVDGDMVDTSGPNWSIGVYETE